MVVPFTLLLVSPPALQHEAAPKATFFRRGSDRSTQRSPLSADPLADAGDDRDYSD
jgi:hypothetical protein